jgi:hypothetical protein
MPWCRQPTPAARLRSFLQPFDRADQRLFRAARTALRRRFPAANELVYAYGHSVVIAFSPTERGIEAVASIALRTDGVRLYLMHGPRLPDPKRMLRGSGKQTRFIPVQSARTLAQPDVVALIAAASRLTIVAQPALMQRRLLIQSSTATRRQRRTKCE